MKKKSSGFVLFVYNSLLNTQIFCCDFFFNSALFALKFKEIYKISDKEYLNTVTAMQLNGDYVAAFMGNQLQLHAVSITQLYTQV